MLTAALRAKESARPDALFSDPFAATLAGERGASLVSNVKCPLLWEFAVAIRTRVIDDLLFGVFAENEIEVVINLGAGLDARPYRLTIPKHVRWIEVDQAPILAYKSKILASFSPQCTLERVTLDLTDARARATFLNGIGKAQSAVIITEGVLVHLPLARVDELTRDLHANASIQWWILDHATSTDLELIARAWGLAETVSPGEQFAPADAAAFFAERGWSVSRAYASRESAAALNRVVPVSALAELLPLMPAASANQHARSGYALLSREDV